MNGHQVAWWAGISAFFGTVLAIGAIDILNPDDRLQFLSGIVVGLITGGAVYAKQRLDDAKGLKAGTLHIQETGDKKIFSLEVEQDIDDIEKAREVTFRVKKGD